MTYCSKCGSEMISDGEPYLHPKWPYDSYTGKKNMLQTYKCSKSKWIFSQHDWFTVRMDEALTKPSGGKE